ncbi:MAG TPA: hypothetical protein VLY24_28095 [Bryobacteraceae bacterium]|nr:hypothetical protein [Bryobacteraceae bacterium]
MTPTPDWHKPQPKHLPQPSYAPALMALGLTLVLWGVVTNWIVSAIGLVVTAAAAWLWIGNVGAGIAALHAEAPRRVRTEPQVATVAQARAKTPWLHRSALALALVTLALVVLGSGVTSQAGSAWEVSHLLTGAAAGLLTLIVALLLRSKLGWLLLAAVLLQAALGNRSPGVAAFHAFLAHLFFAATVAVALVTSPGWQREPEIATDMAKPSLRTLSIVTVVLLIAQIALGSAVRHKVMGSGIHITFAMVVALAIVVLGVLVMNQCATHRILRPAAIAMMVIAGAQVFLGFGAFIVRMMVEENTLPVQIATMAHVTTGALTLAATVVLALQIRRNLRPPSA